MDDPLKLVIPIVAIVMVLMIPIAWFYFDSRNKQARYRAMERMAQSGQDPKMLERMLADEPTATKQRKQPYRGGLICLAIGAAFLIADRGTHEDSPPEFVGLVLVFLGIALILSDFMNRHRTRHDAAQRPPDDPNPSA
jgi:hypothetical protein